MPPEELKRLRELCEAWYKNAIDYLDYAQQSGDALPSLLDEVERLRAAGICVECGGIVSGHLCVRCNKRTDRRDAGLAYIILKDEYEKLRKENAELKARTK